ncbi:hypothetical protein PL78_02745 [Yersinia entomophaga]|uniref:diguanylate cyclase n=1 Tax=Yersinia entomophaga TaxID=935293 RepID=A0ABM6BH14_YERET|nr:MULTISPECIES: GGDEF domain-containing protein [Yersinia]ANI28758.1 hypothetical protein PL78_02745 [Yersinia entomophaga]OWF89709.1 hypothetical protein B4914_02320 [Yersinia entomophaga]
MRVKYLIYFFTLSLMLFFSVFVYTNISRNSAIAENNKLNLYKIERLQEFTEAFQAVLHMHRLKKISLIKTDINQEEINQAVITATKKIAIFKKNANSIMVEKLGATYKYLVISSVQLMDKLIANDLRASSGMPLVNSYLYDLNNAFYISEVKQKYSLYTIDNRLIKSESYIFLEAIRINSRLVMTLTDLVDQIVDINLAKVQRPEPYLKAIQLTGVLYSLQPRFGFIEKTYRLNQMSHVVNDLQGKISLQNSEKIANDLYLSMTKNEKYNVRDIYEYVNYIDSISQRFNSQVFEKEIKSLKSNILKSNIRVESTLSIGMLLALFIIVPCLIFCVNINKWLSETTTNIKKLSQGNMNIENQGVYLSQDLIAITDAIKDLRRYQLDKVLLESEKQNLIGELEKASFIDPLTNIYNRRKLFNLCEAMPAASYPMAFALIDIDNFKSLNDTYGHDVGDKVLIEFSKLLISHFRSTDIFSRYGGEEFAIVLSNCTPEDAIRIMNNLRLKVKQLTLKLEDGTTVMFRISCGIAMLNNYSEMKRAIKQADEALYYCKGNGKDRVSFYTANGFI